MEFDFIAGDTAASLLVTILNKVTHLPEDLSAEGTTVSMRYKIVDGEDVNAVVVALQTVTLDIQNGGVGGQSLYAFTSPSNLQVGTSNTGLIIGQVWSVNTDGIITGLQNITATIGPKLT